MVRRQLHRVRDVAPQGTRHRRRSTPPHQVQTPRPPIAPLHPIFVVLTALCTVEATKNELETSYDAPNCWRTACASGCCRCNVALSLLTATGSGTATGLMPLRSHARRNAFQKLSESSMA